MPNSPRRPAAPLRSRWYRWRRRLGQGSLNGACSHSRPARSHNDDLSAPATRMLARLSSWTAAKERATATSPCGDHPIHHDVAGERSVQRGKSGRSHAGASTKTRGDRNETLKVHADRPFPWSRRPRSASRSFVLATPRAFHLDSRRRVVASSQPGRIAVVTTAGPTGRSGPISM